MAINDGIDQQTLVPPAVTALRQDGSGHRVPLERTNSVDIRAERQDLKEAAEQTLNVILDLGLDGKIRWVSPSWKDVVGSTAESVRNKPIEDILLCNTDCFANAVESMKRDDSKSRIIRFQVHMGPHSVLRKDPTKTLAQSEDGDVEQDAREEDHVLNLEGQGIMVYDRSSGGESHVWHHRPHCSKSLLIRFKDHVDAASIQSTERNHNRPSTAACRISWCGG